MNTTNNDAQGVVTYPGNSRTADYLYRISVNALILNDAGEVLLVKESGRDWWDLPGGGMEHGEDMKAALTRELQEEIGLQGDFSYRIADVDDPSILKRAKLYQVRLVFLVTPEQMDFQPGEDGDEVAFFSLETIKTFDSAHHVYLEKILGRLW